LKDRGLHGVKLFVSDDHAEAEAGAPSGVPVSAVATLPTSSAAERRGLCAAAEHGRGGGGCGATRLLRLSDGSLATHPNDQSDRIGVRRFGCERGRRETA